ncbi:hypothetical protein [Streptomyces sp. NPDC002588]|uniref:hypothetical protein n=1 Tax=Streptomyces sp. NPDC002588 TaxID=3154419 RepID=UPI0033253C3B
MASTAWSRRRWPVRDRLNTHVPHTMRELIAAREWLTVFLQSAYAPELNPVEGPWAHVTDFGSSG